VYKILFSAFILTTLWGCNTLRNNAAFNQSLEVQSWEILPVTRFANIVKSARVEKRPWVKSPALYASHLLNLSGVKAYRVDYVADRGESNTLSTILIYRDGFLDDSVRGDVHEFELKKIAGGWQIQQVRRAIRCWRNNQDHYALQRCL